MKKIFEKIKEKLPFKKTKENSANKKNKKLDHKKSKLKTFLNVLAYIFGGIFLILLLFSCINSCKGQTENNKEQREVKLNLDYTPPELEDTTWLLNSPFDWYSNSDSTQTFTVTFTSYNSTYDSISINPNTERVRYYYGSDYTNVVYSAGDFLHEELRTINITSVASGNYISFATWLSSNATQVINGGGNESSIEPSIEPSIDDSIDTSIDNSIVDSEYTYIDTIVFNNAFDWRILFSGGYQKNTGLFFLNSDYAIANPVVHFTGMDFVCDGVLYNTIDITLIVCDNASVVYTGYNDEGKQIEYVVNTSNLFSYNNDKSLCAIAGVYYRYYNGSVDNLQNVTEQVHVYNGTQINYIAPSSEGGSTYVQSVNYNLHEWLGNNYKKLAIVHASDQGANSLYPNISTYELITNNENLVITEYGELGDVFSLLGGGFTALTSVFGIYILPNISIGVLIFLPLVVVMFITIIRLIKK